MSAWLHSWSGSFWIGYFNGAGFLYVLLWSLSKFLGRQHQHVFEPRGVTHWRKNPMSIDYTTLLEQCACGVRKETEWVGAKELIDFMPKREPVGDVVERELAKLKDRGKEKA